MSALPEVTVVSSDFQDEEIDSPSPDDWKLEIDSPSPDAWKLSEKVAQFLKIVKDIDDVLDTWVGSSSTEVFVKLSNREIMCLQNLESSALDAIMLDIYNRTLSSFSSYIRDPDSILRQRLLVSVKPPQMQRPQRGASASSQYQKISPDLAHFLQSKITDDQNISEPNQTFTCNTTNSNINVEGKGKPSSLFGLNFPKWRRSSESTLSTEQSIRQRALGIPACSSNIMNYTQRRNSDTGPKGRESSKCLTGRELSKLRRVENIRDQCVPTESTSEIAQLFGRLMRKISNSDGSKRKNSLDTCSLADSSYRDDCSTSSSSVNVDNLKDFSEADTEPEGNTAKDYKTMYSSAPNISSIGIVEADNLFNREYDITSNVKVGQAQSGMFRSGSLKVLNLFRNILPGEKPCKSQPLLLPRRLSMDSQLAYNRIPTFEKDNIKPFQRTIKINRPEHSRAMYISAADTLGGLPENEELSFPHRLMRAQFNSPDEGTIDYLNIGRRASCPVILETEESDECVRSRKFRLMSAKSTATDVHSGSSDTGESGETVHSLDESANKQSPCYKTTLVSEKPQHQISDSATSSGSYSGADLSRAPSLLEGVTFIVDKRPRFREGQQEIDTTAGSKHSSRDVSSDDRDRHNDTSSADGTSSEHELNRRPKKIKKKIKKRKKYTKDAKRTHYGSVGDVHTITNSKTYTLSSPIFVIDKTSSDSCEQSNNNGLQVEITPQEHNNNSLVWNGSSTSINLLVREIESSSYFSDISSADK